jgi:hypothetical protein
MAAISVSDRANVGSPVVISGSGFTGDAVVAVEVAEAGVVVEITADAAGYIGGSDVANHALTTLTVSGNAVADETVTLDAVVYTWKAAPTTVANQVKVGATAADSLQNLKDAVNRTGTPGTQYGSLTVVHPTIEAGAITATTLKFNAKVGGTGGNSLASTETMTVGAFPGATFNSGTPGSAATANDDIIWSPTHVGYYNIKATDGTNTATLRLQVWS